MSEQRRSDEATKAEVIAAEQLRCKAIAEDDFATIERLLGDELSYLHSTGRREDKSELLASLKAAPRSIEREPLDVRLYGDVAVVVGGYAVSVGPRDAPPLRRIDAHGLQVWVKRDARWQLVAHQGAAKVDNP